MSKSGISKYRPAKGENNLSFSAVLAFCRKFAKWGLLFLYSVWVFVLGILVGRETSPIKFDTQKLQKELAVLRESVMTEEQRHFEIDRDSLYDKMPELDFHQALKSTEDDVGLPMLPMEPSEVPDEKEPEAGARNTLSEQDISGLKEEDAVTKAVPVKKTALKKKKKKPPEIAVQAVRVIPREKRMPPPEKKAEPVREVSVPPPPESDDAPKSGKNITVQVASFKESKDAENLVARLKGKGYPAYMAPAVVFGKGIYYRVRVGYFESRAKASSTRKQLKKDKFESFYTNRD
ncbi:MAG: hypothetical protein B6245_14115 [Desulfobacteraceae bacterium 4572_88]|nr:MAG: hypothetical protein B6245_14115 [Desulfobacteraceae bacterium 4572_88]RLC10636.1 MAG: hypothetical protein DRI57_20085 [Deltaproteobacteria bacterium]